MDVYFSIHKNPIHSLTMGPWTKKIEAVEPVIYSFYGVSIKSPVDMCAQVWTFDFV